MRPVGWLDLDAVARCVLSAPPDKREGTADRVLRRAKVADLYRKRLGRRHPDFGDGSLCAAAEALPKVPVAARLDANYFDALSVVLGRIRQHRAH